MNWMCSNLSSRLPLTHWIPSSFVYLRVSLMTIFTYLLHHHFLSLCGYSPGKHVVTFLIKTGISLDLELPPVPQLSPSLHCKACAKNDFLCFYCCLTYGENQCVISTCFLYFVFSSPSLESQLGFLSPTTASKLVFVTLPNLVGNSHFPSYKTNQ